MSQTSRKRGAKTPISRGRHYRNAPIAEAIIDLQTRFSGEATSQRFDSLKQALADRFPVTAPLHTIEFKLNVQNSQSPQPRAETDSKTSQAGWRLSTKDARRVLLFQQRGFTYSHLAPYSDWATFREECIPLWNEFVASCNPELITRVALRYVNQIRIPSDRFDAEKYFTLYPEVPKGVPQDIEGMFMQLRMPQTDLLDSATVTINCGLLQKERPGETPVLLDLDLSAMVELMPGSPGIWTLLDQFRDRKNMLFEAFITDQTRETFK